jgi:hypothetical protein
MRLKEDIQMTATVRASARTLPEATTRRAILGGVLAVGAIGAAMASAAVPSLGPAPDPIFDLIEAHRTAWARIAAAYDNLQGASPEDELTSEIEARDSELDDAKNKLLKTPPATLVGARAIIEYLIEWEKECDPEMSYEYLSTLLRSPIFASEEARS